MKYTHNINLKNTYTAIVYLSIHNIKEEKNYHGQSVNKH